MKIIRLTNIKKFTKRLLCCMAVCSVAHTPVLLSQEINQSQSTLETDADVPDDSINGISKTKDEPSSDGIVVIVRKRVESLMNVPSTVEVFTAAKIESAGITRPADFLALTPNVTFASSESAGTNFMTIRGVSQVRNGESPVAVVVDGVLMTDPGQFDQELMDIQQIEIVKGPQGALYGRNAIGGAINITTKDPSGELEGKVTVGAGNGNRRKFGFTANIPISDSASIRLAASRTEHDGYIENAFLNKKVDFYENTSVRLRLGWDISEFVVGDFRYSQTKTEGGALNFVLNADYSVFDFVGDADDTSVPRTANRLGINTRDIDTSSLKLDWDADFATLTSITSWTDQSEFYAATAFPYECLPDCVLSADTAPTSQAFVDAFGSPLPGLPGSFVPVQVVKVLTDVETISQELRITSSDDLELRWIAGVYWLQTDRQRGLPTEQDIGQAYSRDLITANTLFAFSDDNDNKAYAAFVQFDYDFSEAIELSLALRYDKDERSQRDISPLSPTQGLQRKANFSELQPKFTARYRFDDESTAFFIASKGFRSGGFNQNGVGAAAAAAGINGINDDYKKEVSNNIELGYRGVFSEGDIHVDGALFRTKLTDQHFFQFIGAINAQLLNNIDQVKLQGLEASIRYSLTEDFELNVAYGLTDSEIEKYTVDLTSVGNLAPYVAKSTFNLGAQYDVSLSELVSGFIRMDYEIRGKQYWDTTNSTSRKAIELVNLNIGVESEGGWSARAWVKNLTDEVYNEEFVSGGFAVLATPQTFGLEFSYRF